MIRVVLFASIRETLGINSLDLDIEAPITIPEVITHLATTMGPAWADALEEESILVAVNQTMTDYSASLEAGDELAFFPPVTGG